MTNSASVAKVPAQPACKRRLAGSWGATDIMCVEAWISDSAASPPGKLTSPEIGLPFRHFDDRTWCQALSSFRSAAQKRGVKKESFPDFVWKGLERLGLTNVEPTLVGLSKSLKAEANFSLVLMPEPLGWKLEMAFLAQGVVPVVPFLGSMDKEGRVDVADLRRHVCGFLPLVVGDPSLRDFVRAFARTAAKTESADGTEFLKRLWHASVLNGIVQVGKDYKPYGVDLITDGPRAEWACSNAATKRRLLTLDTLQRTRLAELEARDANTIVFMTNAEDSPKKVMLDFLSS
jgi:phenylalanine-4-hydroxylase